MISISGGFRRNMPLSCNILMSFHVVLVHNVHWGHVDGGEVFDEEDVTCPGHGLGGRGPDAVLVGAQRALAGGPHGRPAVERPHLLKVLLVQVSQGHVNLQVLLSHLSWAHKTKGEIGFRLGEELEVLVQQRLEVDVLPLQHLHAGVVLQPEVEAEVLGGVGVVAAVGDGAHVGRTLQRCQAG